jgi:hypothetical protein
MATETLITPPVTPVPVGPVFAGFDTDIYPGDHAMSLWKLLAPYVFAAYYLHAPCHRDQSWMGHRAALTSMGWNLVPVYVGQQVAGASPCGSCILTAAQGGLDAADCSAKMSAEGFPAGTFVFLDVEHCDTFPGALGEYITAWVAGVVAGGFGPGVYCHAHNASDVQAAVAAGVSKGVAARFWIAGGDPAKFVINRSPPAYSGIAFADLWQCPETVTRTYGGVRIEVDENCSMNRAPAGPGRGPAVAKH